MSIRSLKLAALAAFHQAPQDSQLSQLRAMNATQEQSLLQWLDQSGLALYLLTRLRETDTLSSVSTSLCAALENRLQKNKKRVDVMLDEVGRVDQAFRTAGVKYTFLKGFSLAPDFCSDPVLRHHIDIDMFVRPENVDLATEVALECGYQVMTITEVGEVVLSTPHQRLASRHDDIYGLPAHFAMEFHSSAWEPFGNVNFALPETFCRSRVPHRLREVTFPALALPDRFLLQVLHAFRHFLASWLRMGWLYEIAHFLETPRSAEFWLDLRNAAGSDPLVREACGLMLALTSRIFGNPIPDSISRWCVDPLSPPLRAWVDSVGLPWALCGRETNKSTLLVHRRFVDDAIWWRYVRERMLPYQVVPRAAGQTRWMRQTVRDNTWTYWASRLSSHARSLSSLPMDYLRWTAAVRAESRKH